MTQNPKKEISEKDQEFIDKEMNALDDVVLSNLIEIKKILKGDKED